MWRINEACTHHAGHFGRWWEPPAPWGGRLGELGTSANHWSAEGYATGVLLEQCKAYLL